MSNLVVLENKMLNGKIQPTTTSRRVAKYFNKQHAHVLRDIRNMQASDSFRLSNFGLTCYEDSQGISRDEYSMSRDGTMLVIMSYTGEKAMVIKEAYIAEFNRMESLLHSQSTKPNISIPQAIQYLAIESLEQKARFDAFESKVNTDINELKEKVSKTPDQKTFVDHYSVIRSYKGKNEWCKKMQKSLSTYGRLTTKQIACFYRNAK